MSADAQDHVQRENSFVDLIAQVRAGDERAAADLLRFYEPQVRRIVRVRLTDPRMRRQIDTMDICQSVMSDFFIRMALGQYEIESPEHLIKLLSTMARNKLLHHVERQQAARRDVRRLEPAGVEDVPVAAADPTPSRVVSARELLAEVRTQLNDDERFLADERAAGRTWAELGEQLQAKPDSLRMKLSRAVDRVAERLGLNEAARG